MKNRFTAIMLSAALTLGLCGCGGMFDSEYVVVNDYVPAVQAGMVNGDTITIASFNELKQAILGMVSAGKSESRLTFDQAYDGDVTADMASACWEVRTQDALCAYCVENIAYDLAQIVTYYEATIYISYSNMVPSAQEIVHMQYSTDISEIIRGAIEQGQTRLAVLINRSSYSAATMELLVSRLYRATPGIAPREPYVNVNLFSGTGLQRLYEINLSYGVSAQELELRKEQMAALDPFSDMDIDAMDDARRAIAACQYLADTCQYEESGQYDNIYSALIRGQSASEGMALAYVELCSRLGISCQIVYGQRNWQDHCWNIIQLDGANYHVDPAICSENGLEGAFLLRDENIWGTYRWDTSSYPDCAGPLTYLDLTAE